MIERVSSAFHFTDTQTNVEYSIGIDIGGLGDTAVVLRQGDPNRIIAELRRNRETNVWERGEIDGK